MTILVIDVGTTHCKAALVDEAGALLRVTTGATPRDRDAAGAAIIPPAALWQCVAGLIAAVTAAAGRPHIAAVGVASMAETGLLLDRRSGAARTPLLPWFESSSAPYATWLAEQAPDGERFGRFGIYPSAKSSLAKILQVRERDPAIVAGAVWLCAADYIVYRLSGAFATDYSLAGRTYAFSLRDLAWDSDWLRQLGLPADLFPPALPSGEPVGRVSDRGLEALGLTIGAPVAVCGHDHVCAAFAAGAVVPGRALDSMGTAEVLIGALDELPAPEVARASGLTFGQLPAVGRPYWLGGLPAAGGSLDWLRGVLGDPPLSYADLAELEAQLGPRPGELLYLPYLAGSGAPQPNPAARGALVGLAAGHSRADLLLAVLEGTAYQLESIRRAANGLVSQPIATIVVAGGGARIRAWLQIKADIYGVPLDALADAEATLCGAALIAGVGCGIYADAAEALAVAARRPSSVITPDPAQKPRYAERFATLFQPWQQRLTHQ